MNADRPVEEPTEVQDGGMAAAHEPEPRWQFRLYVAGQSPKSMAALGNLRRLCEEYLAGDYDIELVDLVVQPELAQQDQILAVPTLVRRLPQPLKRIIGDLSDYERSIRNLDLRREP